MSRRILRSWLYPLLAALAISFSVLGFAGASSIEHALDGGLTASAPPALLGPITESGRTGWACKPEKAASAKAAADAELPSADTP
ncbi:MAG TPA: hypothetical protein VFE17_07805 [Candidatus Baltobacteraceae bacterium]|jgi:hypothetical protein|nr:hypothetical protein [Candidatus Baltobacteraceae bacterium]